MKNPFVAFVVGVAAWILVGVLAERQLHLTRAVAYALGFIAASMVDWPRWRSRSPGIPFVRYAAFALAGGLTFAALGMVFFK